MSFDRDAVAAALREGGSIAGAARLLTERTGVEVERRRLSEHVNADDELGRIAAGMRAARSAPYRMSDDDRLRPVLVVPDVHAPYHDRDAWALMLDVARDLKPETIVCIGDLADFYAISAHSKDPDRAADLKDEVRIVRELRAELDELGATTKVFCEGNHEYRLARYLRDKAPELFELIDVPSVLGLTEAGWDFIPYRDHIKRGAMHYTHDVGASGRYAAFKSLDMYQHSNTTGHTHRLVYIVEGNAVGEAKVSASFGWLGDVTQIDYMHRAKAKKDWALAFGIGYEDRQTGHTFLVPIPIVEYRCVFNGKLYKAPSRRKAGH